MNSPSDRAPSAESATCSDAAGEGTSAPLLSVCIPTYNRARHVEAQARSIIDNILSQHDNVELVVVNNVSKDDTTERLAKLSHPNFRLINRRDHCDTAEESMMRALDYVSGDYVWILGDDDPVHLTSIDLMLSRIARRDLAVLIFNSTTIRPQGHVADLQPMPMNGPIVSATLDRIVESIGLVNTFAGTSNIVQLRRNLDVENGLEWLRTSKIYSHVAWFVEAHKGQRAAFINMPLVFYRLNDYSDGHWDRAAERFNVPSLYFWSLGLVRLLSRLVDRGCISAQQVGHLFELAESGARYRLIDDVVFKTHSQLLRGARSDDPRERLSSAEIDEIRTFCLRCDPTLFDLMEIIRNGHDALFPNDGQKVPEKEIVLFGNRFLTAQNDRRQNGRFAGWFVGRVHGFDLYRLPLCFAAVHHRRPDLRDATLQVVDPVSDGRNVFVADDYDALVDCLTRHQAMLSATAQVTKERAAQALAHEPHSGTVGAEVARIRLEMDRLQEMRPAGPMPSTPEPRRGALKRLRHAVRRLFGSSGTRTQNLKRHFDEDWYVRRYPQAVTRAKDAFAHFLRRGAEQGCNPNAYFDRAYYRAANPDVVAAGFDSFEHFLEHGLEEGRRPHPDFSAAEYETFVVQKR